MYKSPLHDLHVAFGAKLVEFGGWEMPLVYRGIIDEHLHTRRACSVFDVSHMGRLIIEGVDAESFLQWVCTRNLSGMVPGQCRYGHICNQGGGILDDVIVTRFDDYQWGVVCNAGNREKIVNWLNVQAKGRSVTLDDQTFDTAMLALQGPMTRDLVAKMVPIGLSELKRYRCMTGDLMGMQYAVYRSGYTGEDGFEIVLPTSAVPLIAPLLLGSAEEPRDDVKPGGLGARDTLRLEAGMPLYGHELSEDIDPLSSGQGWCVDLSVDFVGAEPMRKLKEAGLRVKLVGLVVEGRRIGRQLTPVMKGAEAVGLVTSGTMSATLDKNIAMASVAVEAAEVGTELELDFKGKRASAKVVPLPFYKRPKGS